MRSRVLPYLWYPLSLGVAVTAFGALLAHGATPALAAYPPIVMAGLGLVLLECWDPERRDWRATWRDVKADALFMVLVQIALPKLLAALAVLAVADGMHQQAPSPWWPHAWPLAAQAVMMVLAVDFLRYWLHRACHRYGPLWRLHEVHHSPDILYVLNVARFHPIEKALHFCLDTVPFLLLGVAPEVIACYFVLYSVNGLFQHSNVRLRYGWLNYVVGSAETHRWHHARDPRTAACNFSNTTIVWDLVFGTWRLPGPVGDIGIMDRDYPKGFWRQMWTPFRRGGRYSSLGALVIDVLAALNLRRTLLAGRRALQRNLRDPMAAQRDLLLRIVRENRDTDFGREHGFAQIASYQDYVRRVPVSDFEALRPFVEAEIERGAVGLTAEPPVRYMRTSGTTGKPKDIPLTQTHLDMLRNIHRLAVAFQHRTCPEAFKGGILAVTGAAEEGLLANGKPYGAASGVVAGDTPRFIRDKFVVPAPVSTIADSRLKYLTILRLALSRPDVTYIGSANPTTLLALIKLYRENEEALIQGVRDGTFFLDQELPQDVRRVVTSRLRPDAERSHALSRLRAEGVPARVRDLWPQLKLVVTWTCASAGIAAAEVRRELQPGARMLELGYLSSEFRGTITLGRRTGSGMPTCDTHFFEFVERDRWDGARDEFLTLDQLRKGTDYHVIVTTPSGLYRYFMNDLVTVTGHLHGMPLLKFAQKGKGVTNITGEKVYEAQVLSAVGAALESMGRTSPFVMMLADEVDRCYCLFVESAAGGEESATLAQRVDDRLRGLNVEYDAKRESGRLGALRASWMAADTGEAYKAFCVARGQREGQFKMVALAYRKEFAFEFESRVVSH